MTNDRLTAEQLAYIERMVESAEPSPLSLALALRDAARVIQSREQEIRDR